MVPRWGPQLEERMRDKWCLDRATHIPGDGDRWERCNSGMTTSGGKITLQCHLAHHGFHITITRDWTRGMTVRSRRVLSWSAKSNDCFVVADISLQQLKSPKLIFASDDLIRFLFNVLPDSCHLSYATSDGAIFVKDRQEGFNSHSDLMFSFRYDVDD